MSCRNEDGAQKFKDAMLEMSGRTVGSVSYKPTNTSSGAIYKINRLNPPADGLWVRQGYGRGEYKGSLGFQFTLAKAAQVDGFLSLEEIAERPFTSVRNNDDKRIFVRTITDSELDKLIAYLEGICPKISEQLFPEWHRDRG